MDLQSNPQQCLCEWKRVRGWTIFLKKMGVEILRATFTVIFILF